MNHIKNNINHSRTKHIKRRHHFIREAFDLGEVEIQHIPAVDQVADVLTKPLAATKHADAVKLLNLVSYDLPTSV